jgi:hypothetical protein
MVHNDKVFSWYKKTDKLQNSVSESMRKAYLPKYSYLSDGKTVNVDFTPDERKAIYADIAKSFNEIQKEGDALLADLQNREESPEITDDIEAVSGKLASFLTNIPMYDYSEGQSAANKFEKIRAKYLEIYNRYIYKSGKTKLQEMVKKSGIIYTDPAKKAELDKQRVHTQSHFDNMNRNAAIAQTKKQND